jgi:ubiquinone/menaquinone biosynthesis C-methylase UbiE
MADEPKHEPESSSHGKQAREFLESEGNNWFQRNNSKVNTRLIHYETETTKRVLQSFKNNINNILEIGCGNGVKLVELCDFFGSGGAGVDPSSIAIKEGIKLHKSLNLSIATASDLPHGNNEFDLVYFGFCLYLLDREDLFKAVAEADRVLKSGGFIAVLDFDPKQRHRRPYHHKNGLFSYKTCYSDFFIAGGHYYLVAKDSFSHDAGHFSEDSDERVSLCVLYKEPNPYEMKSI